MVHINITVRPAQSAQSADQPLIRKLVHENNLNPLDLAWHSFSVAVDEQDHVVGCGQIKQHGSLQELASLVVAKDCQGKGVSNLLMDDLLQRANRPLWLMCESPLTAYYERTGFREVNMPSLLPLYFQNIYWFLRLSMGMVFFLRGTYVAFMVLRAQTDLSDLRG